MNPSLQEINFYSPELKREASARVFVYRGPSMHSTFRSGQLLFVYPVEKDLHPGDVIVFRASDRSNPVVHRIIAISPEGLITRGDNNSEPDPQPVKLEQVLGRAEMVADQDRLQRIVSGAPGLRRARVLVVWKKIITVLKRIFWSPYDHLRKSGWAAHVWRPTISKVSVRAPQGRTIKYIIGKQTVAVWNKDQGFFQCKKPFDLVIHPPV